jgi:hypothetical protein
LEEIYLLLIQEQLKNMMVATWTNGGKFRNCKIWFIAGAGTQTAGLSDLEVSSGTAWIY